MVVMSPTLATLGMYTGWYQNKTSSERVIITIDDIFVRVGYLNTPTGSIEKSFVLALNGPAFRVGGDTKEGTSKIAELQAIGNLQPGDDMVVFDIKSGEIDGLELGSLS
ncbi:hypothetical protein EJ02DRAFT_508875 [Clathrospora elynae]|uniref:Uncharacterized protein n=1 Tax=Clathrospora elynae TaxID=706981 RepID=A0A6A5T2A8_9PLEO|nr:hypothetical protein EJ02DRAFT_508875 [Clathrospora elynae]